jgi:hypothetical protein
VIIFSERIRDRHRASARLDLQACGQGAILISAARSLIKCLAICYRVIAYSTSSLGSKRTAPGRAALGRATLGLVCFEADFATCLDAWVVFFG